MRAAPLVGWLERQDLRGLDDPRLARDAFSRAVDAGVLDLPLPAGGSTAQRWHGLAALGRADLVLARLGEGHLDATAILSELGAPAPRPGQRWGVWAADPPTQRVAAEPVGARWRLHGSKGWCSGAGSCTHALVTAHAPDGYRLFAVDLDQPGAQAVDGSWLAYGMRGSDSRSVRLTGADADAVGGPGAYLDRPGFWHGGIDVAAVWYGGAVGVADALRAAQARRPLDAHALAHLGAVDAALHAAAATLERAAAEVDAAAGGAAEVDTAAAGAAEVDTAAGGAVEPARLRAMRARAVVERTAVEVLDRVGRALGAAPLALDARHSRRVADLTVFLRQSHAERDLQALATLLLDADVAW